VDTQRVRRLDGRGIGAELIGALLARENEPLYLRCNEKCARYYERFGFRRVKPWELPPDLRRDYCTARIISAVPFFLLRRSVRIVPMQRGP
jgi:N-acetylglutamate synthase-like GNAT family acetyltransferase